MFWFIVGACLGFYCGIWGTLKILNMAYPHIYREFENGDWKVKYYNAKAKAAEEEDEIL